MDNGFVPGQLRLAPNMGFTHLPFGGGVLLDSRTLAIIECDERDAKRIAGLLAEADAHDSEADLDDADARRLASQLLEAGWLVAVPERK